MDTIESVMIVGIIFFSIYKIFELIIRRRERLMFIDKWNPDGDDKLTMPDFGGSSAFGRFTSLRAGCLLCGIGLGLMVGILLVYSGISISGDGWHSNDLTYGASLMIFGGLGMLISFIIEMNMTKKDQ